MSKGKVLERFSPGWFARTLGFWSALIMAGTIVAREGYDVSSLAGAVEPACWAYLVAAMGGWVLGIVLAPGLHSWYVPEGSGSEDGSALVDAELPGTMPPLTE
ncbi:MAG: hypothetical protein FJX76_18970 [Armatimonadetes bacterium]|nr:hypothetical protein [Armatimonadota bacterium]